MIDINICILAFSDPTVPRSLPFMTAVNCRGDVEGFISALMIFYKWTCHGCLFSFMLGYSSYLYIEHNRTLFYRYAEALDVASIDNISCVRRITPVPPHPTSPNLILLKSTVLWLASAHLLQFLRKPYESNTAVNVSSSHLLLCYRYCQCYLMIRPLPGSGNGECEIGTEKTTIGQQEQSRCSSIR